MTLSNNKLQRLLVLADGLNAPWDVRDKAKELIILAYESGRDWIRDLGELAGKREGKT